MKDLIGEPVFVLATARTGNMLEYYGILEEEDKESVTLKEFRISLSIKFLKFGLPFSIYG